ncbi:MAG: ribonuclease HIII, partial [Chlamydiia bacterium]|nr:ribonuclease HIII [Chlamydiia bacterium]
MSPTPKPSGPFVAQIDLALAPRLQSDLKSQGFELTQPPHTVFAAKKQGISCTLYQSGKLVVQGKASGEFIEFYLEPEILQDFAYTHADSKLDLTPRIGIDEAGKGDFFGPLCVGGLYANSEQVKRLQQLGVRDSKNMKDTEVIRLARELRDHFDHVVIRIGPQRYNQMYAQFKNLNRLLAWGHATALQNLAQKTGCHTAIIDQFAAEHVVERALRQKGLELDLTQRTKGENDLVVAGASILARATFVKEMERLSEDCGME